MLSVIKNTAKRMKKTKPAKAKITVSKNIIEEYESLKKISVKKKEKINSCVELNLVADKIVQKANEVARKLGINCDYEIKNQYNAKGVFAEVNFLLVEQIGIFSFAKFSEYLETQIPSFISSVTKEPESYLTECSGVKSDNRITITITKI